MIKKMWKIFLTAGLTSVMAASLPVQAQSYPDRPIRLVVGYPPGGPTDVMARHVAERLTAKLGQAVVVENKAGAGGNIAATYVARASADGYTLLMTTVATHGIAPAIYKNLPYDPIKDFAPVAEVGRAPSILVVTNSLPVKTVADLIEHAKRNPGKLNFASGGIGTSMHFTGELFRALTKVDIVHVPYQGSSAAYNELIPGTVQLMFDPQSSIGPMIKAGKVRPLAVASSKRSTLFPDVPTTAEAGLKDMEVSSWSGIVVPAKTPESVISKLAKALGEVSKDDTLRERLNAIGAEPTQSSPDQFAALIKSEIDRWTKVAQQANVKLD